MQWVIFYNELNTWVVTSEEDLLKYKNELLEDKIKLSFTKISSF